MATFTVNGYQMRSNSAHLVEEVHQSEMQVVSSLGLSTLECTYMDHAPGAAEVSLADYNLLLNGTHLNDGQLPDKIELFDLTWGTNGGSHVSRVLNLVFKEADGWRDEVFAVDQSPLPSIVNAAQANSFLSASRFSIVDTQDTEGAFEIQLDKIPDVEIRGVLLKLFDGETEDQDGFFFMQEFDAEIAEVGFAEIETQESDVLSETIPLLPLSDYASAQDEDEGTSDTTVDDFGF
ncbi:MAG: hypothetical protein AAF340_03400 [Pseudomonadota bacterium]